MKLMLRILLVFLGFALIAEESKRLRPKIPEGKAPPLEKLKLAKPVDLGLWDDIFCKRRGRLPYCHRR